MGFVRGGGAFKGNINCPGTCGCNCSTFGLATAKEIPLITCSLVAVSVSAVTCSSSGISSCSLEYGEVHGVPPIGVALTATPAVIGRFELEFDDEVDLERCLFIGPLKVGRLRNVVVYSVIVLKDVVGIAAAVAFKAFPCLFVGIADDDNSNILALFWSFCLGDPLIKDDDDDVSNVVADVEAVVVVEFFVPLSGSVVINN
ncbi:hypothetical protein FF38_10319 [Lucilia cuprina]|uniref:Uncharacterized protein n=1 Tax=Lucilia cuprina TaxID=7375 RepID=A0A0L0BLY8_LUCCU|nr:hypothetical protein FF38_10319 [Lucilia cuprina]